MAVGDIVINGRPTMIHVLTDDWIYKMYWDGVSAWERRKIKATIAHPGDNELILLDLQNDGEFRWLIDSSPTNGAFAHIWCFN